MSTFINLFTDFGFKKVFGQEENKKLLIGFLNALFEGEFVIRDVAYRDKEQAAETKEGRCVIYDIFCTLDDGKHIVLEMQNESHVNFDARALYYVSKSIVAQGKKGHEWQYTYAPVFGVYFMNFHHKALGTAYRVDFGITRLRSCFVDETLKVAQAESPESLPFADKMRLICLQMPAFTKTEGACVTDLDKWMYLMNNMEKLEHISWEGQDEMWAELAKVSNVAALSEEERFIYEEKLRNYWDRNVIEAAKYLAAFEDGEKKGREEGREEGEKKGQLRLLSQLMKNNHLSAEAVVDQFSFSPKEREKMILALKTPAPCSEF